MSKDLTSTPRPGPWNANISLSTTKARQHCWYELKSTSYKEWTYKNRTRRSICLSLHQSNQSVSTSAEKQIQILNSQHSTYVCINNHMDMHYWQTLHNKLQALWPSYASPNYVHITSFAYSQQFNDRKMTNTWTQTMWNKQKNTTVIANYTAANHCCNLNTSAGFTQQ